MNNPIDIFAILDEKERETLEQDLILYGRIDLQGTYDPMLVDMVDSALSLA